MSQMHEQCVYVCGPYKDYCGRAEYDEDADVFHGEVIGTRDVITFQGKALDETRSAFKDSVDDYLAYCKQQGDAPEKPFSGKFVARLDPDLHRRVSMMAQVAGKSLNQFVCDCLDSITKSGMPTICPEPTTQKKKSHDKQPRKRAARKREREYA